MSRSTFASHPNLLGFDELDRMIDRLTKSGTEGYPPFNIEQRGPNSFRITLAVAGFAEEDLGITVEESHLVVRGRQADEGVERQFLHRGIAARQFQKSFVLADRLKVTGAHLDRGLLHVDLERREPEPVVQTIHITRPTEE
jgi:HSP20 family molecular chaperone IbpA